MTQDTPSPPPHMSSFCGRNGRTSISEYPITSFVYKNTSSYNYNTYFFVYHSQTSDPKILLTRLLIISFDFIFSLGNRDGKKHHKVRSLPLPVLSINPRLTLPQYNYLNFL